MVNTMNKSTLKEAIEEAAQFLEKANKLYGSVENNKSIFVRGNPKESGAVRRASMDLTRKLADLRQGR